jgi:hypothetical protein
MRGRSQQFLVLAGVMAFFSATASADVYSIGLLGYDLVSAGDAEFDIDNGTGANAVPFGFPITTQLTFTITNLTVNLLVGGPIVIPGSEFTSIDPDGDLDCTGPDCNLFNDATTSATLTGTVSPTSGISGLDGGDTGISADFNATTVTPSGGATLTPDIDGAIITVNGTGGVSIMPEAGSSWLLVTIIVGIAIAGLKSRRLRRGGA